MSLPDYLNTALPNLITYLGPSILTLPLSAYLPCASYLTYLPCLPYLACLPALLACLSYGISPSARHLTVLPPQAFKHRYLQFDFRFLFAASYWRAPCREKLLWWQPLPSPQIPEAKPQFSSQLSRRAVLYCGAASTVTQTYQPTLVASPHVAAIIIIQSISNPNHFDCHRRFITQAASLGGALANCFAVFIFYFYFFILFFYLFFLFFILVHFLSAHPVFLLCINCLSPRFAPRSSK